jgi:hypothetical protein
MRAAHVPLRLGRGSGGRLHAGALGESIFTEADDVAGLHANACDAVRCHFDDDEVPRIIRLHFVREEVITARDFRATSPVTSSREPSAISATGRPARPGAIFA